MKRKLPVTAAAAIAIAIIVATEVVFLARAEPLTGLPVFQPTMDDATLVAKRQLLPRSAGQVVLVGDSSCMMGLDPGPFEKAGLGRAVNLGTLLNLTLPGFALVAEEALRANPAPRALVIAILPRSLETTEAQAHEYGLLGRYLVAYGQWSPIYERRPVDFVSWFARKHRFNLFPPAFGGPFSAFAERVSSLNGRYTDPGTYISVPAGGFKTAFQPTDYSRAGLVQLAVAAKARGVPVVFWWSPSPSDAVSPEYLAGAARYVAEIKNEVPWLTIGGPAPAWNPSMFSSVTHLTPAAALVNSDRLATYLRVLLN